MNQSPIPDIIGTAVLILSVFFRGEIANAVAPYIVIIVAASIGASFALARKEKSTRLADFGYYIRVCGLAIILTVCVAVVISSYYPGTTPRILIAPVAFAIGFFGDDLPSMIRSAVTSIIKRWKGQQ